MLIVAALGGNALLRRGEPLTAAAQRRNARIAARALAPIAAGHDLVVTHGNGPQVGLLAEVEDPADWPLDVIGAETEGMIGYVLEQELRAALGGAEVATLLTQTVVDEADPAFGRPTKPIGAVYDADRADELRARGWTVAPDGRGVRRVVASPEPREVLGVPAVRLLLGAGMVVVCAGGGGIPVVRAGGGLTGVEAVVDKDLAAAVLAQSLDADVLLLLTDVPGGGVDVRRLRQDDLRRAVLLVAQDAHVFATTIRNNLVLARPGADDAVLLDALDAVGLGTFVAGLPEGLDTHVGEDGARLSGGQRRRLLVARALVSDARVLLLDEPAAHLDPEAARRLHARLVAEKARRAILIIAHTTAGLEDCDDTLVWPS